MAAVLLAIGIAATMGAIASATQATSMSEHFEKSALVAQNLITNLSLQPEQIAPGETHGTSGDPLEGYRYTQRIENGELEYLYRVTIIVEWGDPNHTRRRTFTTYLRYNPDEQKQDDQSGDNDGSQQGDQDGEGQGGGGNGSQNR